MQKKSTAKTSSSAKLILFNKPFDVLSQFSDDQNRQTLADFIDIRDVYPAGRLDRDSEGLLLLTDNGRLQHQIAHPQQKMWKTYLVQVEGEPDQEAIDKLQKGVDLKDGKTRPAKVELMHQPDNLWPRHPPVRFRKSVADHWLKISIREGRNRQVRRMTAAVGLPTLRLIRIAIGQWSLDKLQPGQFEIHHIPVNNPEKRNELDTTRHRRHHHRKGRSLSRGQGKNK